MLLWRQCPYEGVCYKTSMTRIVLGNHSNALAIRQARAVVSELLAEWPDVTINQRTLHYQNEQGILEALQANKVSIALCALEKLPYTLPEGLALAAVTKRLEPRAALLSREHTRDLQAIAPQARVGVTTSRDQAFLKVNRKDIHIDVLSGDVEQDLARLAADDLGALLLPCSSLIDSGLRQLADTLLEASSFPPAIGQGALGLLVRADDDLAFEIAYTLQHRPSFDRVVAERSFAQILAVQPSRALGALASINDDGELKLFGMLTDMDGQFALQAEIYGDAEEAEELGRELAQDVLEQLKTHSSS